MKLCYIEDIEYVAGIPVVARHAIKIFQKNCQYLYLLRVTGCRLQKIQYGIDSLGHAFVVTVKTTGLR